MKKISPIAPSSHGEMALWSLLQRIHGIGVCPNAIKIKPIGPIMPIISKYINFMYHPQHNPQSNTVFLVLSTGFLHIPHKLLVLFLVID
jgi:hypothetical protein